MSIRETIEQWDRDGVPEKERTIRLSRAEARVIKGHIFGDPDTKEIIGVLYGYPVEVV